MDHVVPLYGLYIRRVSKGSKRVMTYDTAYPNGAPPLSPPFLEQACEQRVRSDRAGSSDPPARLRSPLHREVSSSTSHAWLPCILTPIPLPCSVASDQGYARMIGCLGSSLVDVLNGGLNDMHLHLSMQNPAIMAPEFRVEKVTAESAELHYRSVRQGLQYIMEGTVQAVARVFFGFEIGLTLLRGREAGDCDHEVYLLTFPRQEVCFTEARQQLHLRATRSAYAPSPTLFYRMFPFHFILDRDCRLLQAGRPGGWQGERQEGHCLLTGEACRQSPNFSEISQNTGWL